MADIFISYSSHDREQAELLTELLASAGLSVWIDQSGIGAATSWSNEIAEALDSCTAFLLLLSSNSLASKNVMKELSLAAEAEKYIVPIELEEVPIPTAFKYHLAGIQRTKFENTDAILQALDKYRSNATLKLEPPERSERSSVDRSTIRIAVMPFEDQSPGHDHEWFSDGLTDELITTLNKLDALLVLDRNTTKVFRDSKNTTVQTARKLNVSYIVHGAVRKAGPRLRIQAALIEASSGAMVWDAKFDGTMEDIFEMQENTARDIVEGLKIKLTPEEETLFDQKMTNSPEVYELILQASRKLNDEKDSEGGLELIAKALELEPDSMPALYMRSIQFSNLYRADNRRDPDMLEQERTTVKRLMALGPETYYCFAARANYLLNIGEPELAMEMAERAMRTMPKRARAHSVLGFIYSRVGQPRKAIEAFRRVLELDPSSGSDRVRLLTALYAGGGSLEELRTEYPAAKQYMQERIVEFPDKIVLKTDFLNAAIQARMAEDAVAIAEVLLSLDEVSADTEYCCAEAFLLNGDIDRGRAHLRSAIDRGQNEFSIWDEEGFKALKGTPEYDYLLAHIVP